MAQPTERITIQFPVDIAEAIRRVADEQSKTTGKRVSYASVVVEACRKMVVK